MDVFNRLTTLFIAGIFTFLCFAAQADSISSCLSASGKTVVSDCTKALNKEPENIEIRFALADGLIVRGNHQKAASILITGLEMYPANQEIKKKLSLTESYLDEQAWVENQRAKQVSGGKNKIDSKVKVNLIRCSKLKGEKALAACYAVLKKLPDNPEAHRGKGDALLSLGRISDAIVAYRMAQKINPSDQTVGSRLKIADGKRKVETKKCLKLSGAAANKACDSALLKGEKDEFVIQQRRGDLLLAKGDKSGALKVFQRAAKLQPLNKGITEKIASLSTVQKTDAVKKPPKIAVEKQVVEKPKQQLVKTLKPSQQKIPVPPVATVAKKYSNAPLPSGATY